MQTKTAESNELLARLDYLPFTKKHRSLLFGSGLGWAFDAMDAGLITYVIAVLSSQWSLSNAEKSWIVAAGFIGMALGSSLGGTLADRIGRKNVFTLTLVVYGIATGASALASGPLTLILLRILIGLGLGAELPVASTLVSELSPKRLRGAVVVWLEAFWAFGWLLAALIGFYIVPVGENGWRVAFAVGAIPALYAVFIRLHLPESVRYLLSKNQVAKAERVVISFEESEGITSRQNWLKLDKQEPEEPKEFHANTLKSLISGSLVRRTIALWIVWFMINFAYYGAFIWIPSILHANGHSLVKSFGYTLIITLAQIPGYAVAAYLIDRWGRRPTLTVFLAGSAASAISFGLSTTDSGIVITGCFLSFFTLGAWGALYALTSELYPTTIRATGAGWAAGFGRIASIIAPFAVTGLLAVGNLEGGNTALLFLVLSAALAIAALATLFLPELKGKSLVP